MPAVDFDISKARTSLNEPIAATGLTQMVIVESATAEKRSSPHHGPVVKGMRRVIIETDEGTRHEYSFSRSVHLNVQ